ncbi:MAG: ABC transporter ATP-binding protein [Bacillota bacterium]
MHRTMVAAVTGIVRNRAFRHVLALPMSLLGQRHSGDIIARLTHDIALAEPAYADLLFDLLSKVLGGVTGIVYLTLLDWRLTVYAVLVGSLGLIVNAYFARPIRRLSEQVQSAVAEVSEQVSDVVAGRLTVRAFALSQLLMTSFGVTAEKVYTVSMKRVGVRGRLSVLNDCLFFASHAGLVAFGAYLAITGTISAGVVVASLGIFGPVIRLFTGLVTTLSGLQSSLASVDRVCDLLALPLETEAVAQRPVPRTHSGAVIELDRVSFGYDKALPPVIKDVSLRIQPGQTVALVGPNGSGKSTLFRLLLGLCQPDFGSVQVNGLQPTGVSAHEVRRTVAWVPQDSYLFSRTIEENIAVAQPEASFAEIAHAAEVAAADSFIRAFPEGYQTQVGEGGTRLSGGQRQRIAVARAVLKNCPIVLLDEATSALDAQSERLVQEAVERATRGRITLMISHDMAMIRHADVIVVLERGSIAAIGTHQELIAGDNPLYREVVMRGLSA